MSVYVLRSGTMVKIGFTSDVRTRFSGICSSSPVPIEFVGYMPGDEEVERHFHEMFKAQRRAGEWFVETEDMKFIFNQILTSKFPEPATRTPKRRTEHEFAINLASLIRQKCAEEWPLLSRGARIEAFGAKLGWTNSRARDAYYFNYKMCLRAYEVNEIQQWLAAPELRDEQ